MWTPTTSQERALLKAELKAMLDAIGEEMEVLKPLFEAPVSTAVRNCPQSTAGTDGARDERGAICDAGRGNSDGALNPGCNFGARSVVDCCST